MGSKVPLPICPDCGEPAKLIGCVTVTKHLEYTLNQRGDVINEEQSFCE